jgi:hypothetical protein
MLYSVSPGLAAPIAPLPGADRGRPAHLVQRNHFHRSASAHCQHGIDSSIDQFRCVRHSTGQSLVARPAQTGILAKCASLNALPSHTHSLTAPQSAAERP